MIYTTALVIPILDTGALSVLESHPDVVIGIVGGAFAAGLAFGYAIYTIFDTIFYGHDAMKQEKRPLLRYMANHVENWDSFSEARQKMFIEMTHTTGKNMEDCESFYLIERGFRSHYNARIVCSLFTPIAAAITLSFFVISSYLTANKFLTLTSPYTWLDIPVAFGIFVISAILYIGAKRPCDEAAQLEYLFIRRRIETDPSFADLCAIAGMNWRAVVENEETYDVQKKHGMNFRVSKKRSLATLDAALKE